MKAKVIPFPFERTLPGDYKTARDAYAATIEKHHNIIGADLQRLENAFAMRSPCIEGTTLHLFNDNNVCELCGKTLDKVQRELGLKTEPLRVFGQRTLPLSTGQRRCYDDDDWNDAS